MRTILRPVEKPPPLQKAKILLVDDNPANLLALRAILDDLNQDLVDAKSGEVALSHIEETEFAVILLDVVMPGISGFELASLIRGRDRTKHIPIIFITSNDFDRDTLEEGYKLGAVDFLVKPILSNILRAKVAGFVELYHQKLRAKQESEQLRLLVEGTAEYAIFMLDPEGRVATWNLGARRIKQYQAEEIIGRHFSQFYPQEAIDRGWPEHELQVARASGRFEDEGWRVRKDGTQFWANVVITALYDETRQLRGFSKITRDLTERKQAEENAQRLMQEEAARRAAEEQAQVIQEQREKLRITLASIGDAVVSTDAGGTVTFLNPVAERLTGWREEDARGKPLDDIFKIINEKTRRPTENPAEKARKEGVIVGLANHTVLVSKDGVERPIDDSAAPIKNDKEETIGVVLVFRDVTERRRTEAALRQSEAETRRLLEFHEAVMANMGEGIYTVDAKGLVTYMNPAAERMFGWEHGELLGRRMHDMTHYKRPDGSPFPIEECSGFKVLHEGKVLKDFDDVFIKKDGSFFPVRYSSAPLTSGDKVSGLVVVFRDVTERKQTEHELRFQARLLDTVGQAAIVADPEGTIIYWNRFAESLYGYTKTEALGQNVVELIVPPESVASANEIMDQLRSGKNWSGESVVRRRDGSTFPAFVTDTPMFDEQNKLKAVVGISVDITKQKHVEGALRFLADASATLATIVDYQSTLQKVVGLAVPHFADWCAADMVEPDGSLNRLAVVHSDPAKVQFAMDLSQKYPGSPESPHGVPKVLRTGESDMMTAIPDALIVQSATDETHLKLLRELGLRSYMCVPLKGRGKMLGVITFVAAESGRRYTQEDLVFAEELARRASIAIENAQIYAELRDADRRKDEFLAMLAHELRNPLAPIRNSLQILKMPRVDAATAEHTTEIMERQVQHLIRLVDDLLDVSRVMRGKIELRPERVKLPTVVARAVETAQPLIEAQRHLFTIHLPPEALTLDADPVRLAQIIGNLLTNAAKYTDPNGHIQLLAQREEDYVVLRVKDNGIGMAPEMLAHVFELFMQVDHGATRTQGGLGIGLTLVKNLVEMHGGTIEAHSAGLGKGSEFVVRLPLARQCDDETTGDSEQGRQDAPQSGHRLLVVDDNKDAANSLAVLLRLKGHDVRVVHDGLSALETAKKYRPEIIFLDIGMPGMDGYEVARRLRQQSDLKNIVLAAVTGWGQQEDRRRTKEAGFNYHLVKPPEPRILDTLLDELK
jgi:PAS domain S-box-containing protein